MTRNDFTKIKVDITIDNANVQDLNDFNQKLMNFLNGFDIINRYTTNSETTSYLGSKKYVGTSGYSGWSGWSGFGLFNNRDGNVTEENACTSRDDNVMYPLVETVLLTDLEEIKKVKK